MGKETVLLSKKESQVKILLTSQFDEEFVTFCLIQCHEAGLGVAIVGLQSYPVKGCHGLTIQPDSTIGEIMQIEGTKKQALIVPGLTDNISHLLADPRVIEFLRRYFKGENVPLVTIPFTKKLLHRMGINIAKQKFMLVRKRAELSPIISELINKTIISSTK